MKNFNDYIKLVRASGHHSFTTQQGTTELGVSRNAFNCGMYKLKQKGDIVSPAKNFYVIVPPEHQNVGCIPADELIPLLMNHWGINYYACLLSAALYHGAAHQKPQVFQVMTEKQLRPITCGKIRIHFIYKKSLASLPIQKVVIKTGYLNVASPELTAIDLLLYLHQAGGLNHVASVLSELIESIVPEKMLELMRNSKEKAWIQRLGYILERIDPMDTEKRDRLVALLDGYLKEQVFHFIPLASEVSSIGASRSQRWKIIENATIENDT